MCDGTTPNSNGTDTQSALKQAGVCTHLLHVCNISISCLMLLAGVAVLALVLTDQSCWVRLVRQGPHLCMR